MPYRTARTIGKRVVPSSFAASGSWALGEVTAARRDFVWPGRDPYFSDVVLLLQDSLADNSLESQTVTALGTSGVTSTNRFGSQGFVGYDSSNYVQVASDPSLAFGTGDFTVEMFLRLPSYSTSAFYSLWTAANNTAGSNRPNIYIQNGNMVAGIYGSILLNVASGITSDTWQHIAFCRASGVLRAFVDGVVKGQVSTGIAFAADTCRLPFSTTSGQTAYFDEVRITKGVARYTAAFTPPTAPHPAS